MLLYVGWEGVGLASYLLIGFWYHKPSAATAAKKAFVMNRVGDAGLAVGMFLTFSTFGTLSYAGVFAGVPAASRAVLTAIGLLMLLGRAPSPRRFRCKPGLATRWRAPPRCPR